MKVITVASLKGGVGKTTLAIYLAEALRLRKKKVLVIDADPNNSLTDFYCSSVLDTEIEGRNLLHVLLGQKPIKEAVHTGKHGQEIIPCTLGLHEAGSKMAQDPFRILGLGNRIKKDLDYDYVIIDTPPSLTAELRAGLYAADMVLTPIAPLRWVVYGFSLLSQELQRAKENVKRTIPHLVVPYMVSETDHMVLEKLNNMAKTKTSIPRIAELKNNTGKGKLLKEGGKAHELFAALAKELL